MNKELTLKDFIRELSDLSTQVLNDIEVHIAIGEPYSTRKAIETIYDITERAVLHLSDKKDIDYLVGLSTKFLNIWAEVLSQRKE